MHKIALAALLAVLTAACGGQRLTPRVGPISKSRLPQSAEQCRVETHAWCPHEH